MLRVDQSAPFIGVVRAGRGALCWRPRWSLRSHRVHWKTVESCFAGRDQRLGVEPHSHRLVLDSTGGRLEVMLRGPWGALALVELRNAVRVRAHLAADNTVPGRFVRDERAAPDAYSQSRRLKIR